MPTPVTASTPYITAANFLKRYDWRTIIQLMSDDDIGEMERAPLLDSTTTEGGNLYEILKDASGELETAVLVGGRYSIADLQALTNNQLAYIGRIVADTAIGKCYQRRPDLFGPPPQQAQVAANVLNALASGERIFGLQDQIDASHMEMTTNQPEDVVQRNGMVVIAQEFFGVRGNRYTARQG